MLLDKVAVEVLPLITCRAHNRRHRFDKGRVFLCFYFGLLISGTPPWPGHRSWVCKQSWPHPRAGRSWEASCCQLQLCIQAQRSWQCGHRWELSVHLWLWRGKPCWPSSWAWLCIVNTGALFTSDYMAEPVAPQAWESCFYDIPQGQFVVWCLLVLDQYFPDTVSGPLKFQKTLRLGCVTFFSKPPHSVSLVAHYSFSYYGLPLPTQLLIWVSLLSSSAWHCFFQ